MRNVVWLLVLSAAAACAVMMVGGFPPLPEALARVGGTIVLAFLGFAFFLVLFQNRFIYIPSRRPCRDGSFEPDGVEVLTFETEDGLRLHGWWRAPGSGGADPPALLFCHGNAGNLTHREENVRRLAEHGLSVFIFDYRGYGLSEGRPTEAGLHRDADAAYTFLTKQRGLPPEGIVVFGRSLGAAVALDLALRRPVAGLILEGTFSSLAAMGRRQAPFLPVRLVLRTRFDNLGRIGGLRVPLLMLHAERDKIVPMDQGRAVYEEAPDPKEFIVVHGATHVDTFAVGGEFYYEQIARFCAGPGE